MLKMESEKENFVALLLHSSQTLVVWGKKVLDNFICVF